jgi:hypothetical protein
MSNWVRCIALLASEMCGVGVAVSPLGVVRTSLNDDGAGTRASLAQPLHPRPDYARLCLRHDPD